MNLGKTTFGGRQPSVEDNLRWKIIFGGRRPSVEDDLRWKMTFGGRWPAMEDDLKRKMTFAGSLHAAYSALRYFFFNWCSTFLYNKYWLFSKTLKNENKPKNDENPKNEGDLQKKGTPKMKTTTQLKTNPKMRGCVRHGSQYTDHNSFITSPLMLIHFAAHSFLRFFYVFFLYPKIFSFRFIA